MERENLDLDLHRVNTSSTDSTANTNTQDKRILGSISGLFINVNNIIGVGIYSTPGLVWEETRSLGLSLILWILGGVISLCGSLVYAELGLRVERGGGEVVYLMEAFKYPKNLLSYIFSLTMMVVIRPGTITADANIFAQYTLYAFGSHDCIESMLHPKEYLTGWEFWQIRLISLASVTFVTLYHMYSNKLANNINKVLTIIKTFTLIIVSLIGLIKLNSSINKEHWDHLFDEAHLSLHSLSVAMIGVLFAYNGYNNLNYSVDELQNPEIKLINSNRYSVIIVGILYILTNIAYISVVPRELVIRPGENPNEIIAGQFAMLIGGETFGRILAFLISISALGVMAVIIWSGSRVIVAAAKQNYIPGFSHLLKQWHPTYNTPVYALGAQYILCSMIILFFSGDDPFKFLINMAMHGSWIYYTLSAVGLLIIRQYFDDGYKLYKVSSPLIYIFIMTGVFIVVAPFFTPTSKNYSVNDYNNSTSNLKCPLNYKKPYPYYLPFLVSVMMILIGTIFWYFDGIYRRFRDVQDRKEKENVGQVDENLQQQRQENDANQIFNEIQISTK